MIGEFEIIKKYCLPQTVRRADVALGIGDDAAIVDIPAGQQLVITTDTLVSGVHFLDSDPPYAIGFKAIAVNLSDVAAMGATPCWVTLSLTLPKVDEDWLKEFCRGFFELAGRYGTQLIGGDMSQGPLSITVTAFGQAPAGQALRRSGAKAGDLIYVTNTLGDAGLGLRMSSESNAEKNLDASFRWHDSVPLARHFCPEPRVDMGIKLRGIASTAIDISDGLAADLGHILEESQVGAEVTVDKIPMSKTLLQTVSASNALDLALTAGDDYELCFTVPPAKTALLEKALANSHYTCIGTITSEKGLNLHYSNGKKYSGNLKGYEHFQK